MPLLRPATPIRRPFFPDPRATPMGHPSPESAVSLAQRIDIPRQPLPRAPDALRAATAAAAAAGVDRGRLDVVLATRHAGPREVALHFELVGPAGAPVVFVAGGISAHRHVATNALDGAPGWAEGLLDAGRTLDPAHVRILAFDYVGADGSIDAPIDTADQADAVALLLDALGIDALEGYIGYSYGALVGLQLAVRHPQRLRRLVAVSGVHRPHPYAAAWRALQRKAVALGRLQCADEQGLSLARQFAMLSYRTPEEFAERFDAPPAICNGQVRVAAEDYLEAAGAKFVARVSPVAWLRLSESIDLHRVDPAQVGVPVTVIAVEGDRLVPMADAVELIEGLAGRGRLRVLRSPFGHDAFLKETDRIDALLASELFGAGARRA